MKKKFSLKFTKQQLRWVPNALTLCNSLCGFWAIIYTLTVYNEGISKAEYLQVFAVSAWIIVFAMVFDAMDGFAARLLNAASMHGLQMDSLADMVTFGVAPAVIVTIMTHVLHSSWNGINFAVYLLCSIYLGCAALRLATYNVHAIQEKKSGEKFTGLPSPGAAAAICSVVLIYGQFSERLDRFIYFLPIYAAILGFLMVSTIPYTHMGRWTFSVRRNRKRLVMLLIGLGLVVIFRAMAVVVLLNLYILSGPFNSLVNWLKRGGSASSATVAGQ